MLQSAADRRLGVFTAQEALAAGYVVDDIKAALRTRRWVRLRKGVYVPREAIASADDRGRHLLASVAVLLSLDRGPVLSHASAARLHGLVLPSSAGSDVRVTDEGQWRTGRGYRVARARLPDDDVVPWLEFATTSAARTLIDCGREWTQLDTVIAMDAAIATGLATRVDLQAAVLSARHRAGIANAARALGLADGRAESPLETKGRLKLLAAGLPVPELQVELHGHRGFVARVDAWYDEAAVAIEFDGRVKYRDPLRGRPVEDVLWEEKRREDRVRGLSVRVVRIVNEDFGPRWPETTAAIRDLLAVPYTGPRPFHVVRRPEPGSATDAA